MEAVPRMPMLAFELKNCSEHVDFAQILKTYIEDFYNESPENYNKECEEIDKLRQTVANIPRDFTGCSTLKKYYAQLQFLQSRFPLEADGVLAVPYTWECVFTGRPITVNDIKFEQACVLYNTGALHSILGALDSRQSPEGMKISCTHFQCASWAFQHLRDTFQSSMSPDFNPELLSFQANLLLAQAQECILEKSMTDNRKNTITAKISSMIVEYYKQAIKSLEAKDTASFAGARRVKEWKRRMELKMAYHDAVMYLYLGSESEEKEKHGEAVAYLQASLDKLNEAMKLAKSEENEDIEASLTFALDVIGGKFNSVKKDNDFVYHEKVPELDSLPELKGASLVKGIPFNPNDTEISGPDIFQRLVPMEAHEASSLYSEEKAQLLRTVAKTVEDKDSELEQYLGSLQLSPDQIFPDAPTKLPQDLLEKCAAISVKPEAIKDLINAMQSLSSVATDTEVNIQEIFRLLEEEASNEKQFQESFGKRGHNVTLDEIHKECSKYKEGLATASKSNQDLHTLMNTHISNLKLLSGPLDELQIALPSPEQHKTPEDDAIIDEMKKLMSKVDEMKAQRTDFLDKLRKDVHNDDVTSALVTREGGSQEEFFKDQLKKHDTQIDLINRNLTAQGNILKALTEANAKYAKIRKIIKDCQQRREMTIEGLKTSFDVYEDLLSKTQKGIDFYKKLENSVKNLLERTSRVCKVQNEEREQIIARLKPKAPAPPRPVAPKPGQAPGGSTTQLPSIHKHPASSTGPLPAAPSDNIDPELMAAMMNDPAFAGMDPAEMRKLISAPAAPQQAPAAPIKSEAPKLKDFLPFMKPKTFGSNKPPQVPQASAPGDPSSGYHYQKVGDIPGIPQSQIPASTVGGTTAHVGGQPGNQISVPPPTQLQNQPQNEPIGELRLDGGRLPSASDQDENAPAPSMSVNPAAVPTAGHLPHTDRTGQLPNVPAQSEPVVPSPHGQLPNDLPVQSPTAPPGAPSVKSRFPPITQSTQQPPGGPHMYYNYPHQPGMQAAYTVPANASTNQSEPDPRVALSQAGQGHGHTGAHMQPTPQVRGHINTQSESGLHEKHGYTAVQYGDMGQPSASAALNNLARQPAQKVQPQATHPQPNQQPDQVNPANQIPQSNIVPSQIAGQYPVGSQSNNQIQSHYVYSTQSQTPRQNPGQYAVSTQATLPGSVPQQSKATSQSNIQHYPSQHAVVSSPNIPPLQHHQVPISAVPGQSNVPSGASNIPQNVISNVPQSVASNIIQPHITDPRIPTRQPHTPAQGDTVQQQHMMQQVHQAQMHTQLPHQQVASNVQPGYGVQLGQQSVPQSSVPNSTAVPVPSNQNVQYHQGIVNQTVTVPSVSTNNMMPQGHYQSQQQDPTKGLYHQPSSTGYGGVSSQQTATNNQYLSSQSNGNINAGKLGTQQQMYPQGTVASQPIPTGTIYQPYSTANPTPGNVYNAQTSNNLTNPATSQGSPSQQLTATSQQQQAYPVPQHHLQQPQHGLAQQTKSLTQQQQVFAQQPYSQQSYSLPPLNQNTTQHQQAVSQHGAQQTSQQLNQQPRFTSGHLPQQAMGMQQQQQQHYPSQQSQFQTQQHPQQRFVQPNQQQMLHHSQQATPQQLQSLPQQPNFHSPQHQAMPQAQQQQSFSNQQQPYVQKPTTQQQQRFPNQQQQVHQQPLPQQPQHQQTSTTGMTSNVQNTSYTQYYSSGQAVSQNVAAYQQVQNNAGIGNVQPHGHYQGQQMQSQGQQMHGQGHQMQSQGHQMHGQGQQIQGQGHQMHGQGQQIQGQGQHIQQGQGQQMHGQVQQIQGHGQPIQQGQNYSYPQQPLKPIAATNVQGKTTPAASANQTNFGHLGQELVSQIKDVGPQPAVMPQGILEPSPVGSPQVQSPGSTPSQTPRPTPSATPQPSQQSLSNVAGGQPSVGTSSFYPNNNQTNMNIAPGSPSHHTPSHAASQQQLQQPAAEQHAKTLNQAVNNLNRNLPVSRQGSGASSTASLDDILSSSPSNSNELHGAVKNNVLTPYRVTAEEIERQKEEKMKTSMTQKSIDPYTDDSSLGQFVGEVEIFAKHVESLTKQTLSGPTPLDKEWREMSEYQEKEARSLSMAIARCYPMKNRFPDIMPYDATRVVLTGGSDDYINASHIGDLSPTCPKMIAAQSPVPCTFVDFWQMVYEQGTEIIVMLNSETEIGMQKSHIYWPEEKNRPIHHGPFQLNLQSSRKKNFWHERIISMTHQKTRHARSVVHLQFIGWPPGGHPENPTMLLQFVVEVHSFYVQQRSLMKPVIVHCSDGIGRTGAFCIIYTMVQEIDHGKGIQSICDIVNKLRVRRKWMVREKDHLKFSYDAVLYYAQDLLMRRGILTNKASFNDKPGSKSGHVHTPTEDFIFGSTMPLSAIQSTVARMTLKERQAPDGGEQVLVPSTTNLNNSVINTETLSHSTNNSAPGSPQKVLTSSHESQPQVTEMLNPSTQNVTMMPTASNTLSAATDLQAAATQQQILPQNGNVFSQPALQQTGMDKTDQSSTGLQSIPQSLADLQNPQTFNLGSSSTPPSRKKITKANFETKDSNIREPGTNEDDPLNMLDPLWSIKK